MKQFAFLLCATFVAAAPPAPASTVVIDHDAYAPARLVVRAGSDVTFVNRDDDAHTVTSASGAFDSKGLDTDGVWHHRFPKPGSYPYFCELHPFMKGVIIVKGATR